MIDTRVFFIVLTPEDMGHHQFYAPVMFHDEEFIKQQGEGWVPVSHTVTPTGDGSALLAIMCTREIDGPTFESIPDEFQHTHHAP